VDGKDFSLFGKAVSIFSKRSANLPSAPSTVSRSVRLRAGAFLHHPPGQQVCQLGQPEVKLGIIPGYGARSDSRGSAAKASRTNFASLAK